MPVTVPVRKAVIPAAGLGTRFLPASKAVPKELLTVVDRPIIQYAVEELVRAGITDICIVTSPGKEAVTNHFAGNPKLHSALEGSGKMEMLQLMRYIEGMAEISAVEQTDPLGLGHAVWVARDRIGNQPFAVVLPDELMDPAGNLLGDMVRSFEEHGSSVIAVSPVGRNSIHLYGCIDTPDPYAALMRVTSVIEKPSPDEAPSDLAIIGRYVLDPGVFGILETVEKGSGGEIQLSDALAVLARQGRLIAQHYRGRRWDAGTKKGFLEATVALAAEHPELGRSFREHLRQVTGGKT
jgi:UTP--glucose-1-phosphate uridylyltransferase